MNNLSQLKSILLETLIINEEDIKLDSRISEDLCADSLDIWEIALDIEQSFKIKITEEEVGQCKTVQDILTLINSRLPAPTES